MNTRYFLVLITMIIAIIAVFASAGTMETSSLREQSVVLADSGELPKAAFVDRSSVNNEVVASQVHLPFIANNWPYRYLIAMSGDITTINFWAYYGQRTVWTSYVLDNFVHSLYGLSHQRFDRIPILASDSPSEPIQEGNFWVVIIALKQGVSWSDGAMFTADDVAFTVNTVLDLQLEGQWASLYGPVENVEVLDTYTVKFYFTEKPNFHYVQSMAPILPQHYWSSVVEQAQAHPDPVTWLYDYVPENEPVLGPFMLGEWVPGSHVDIFRNPNYYFKGLQVTEYANGAYQETLPGVYTYTAYGVPTGTVALSLTVGLIAGSVHYEIYPNQEAAFQAVLDGEVDYVLSPLGVGQAIRDSLESDPDVTTVLNQDYGLYYLAFNMRESPMDVLEFRQSVATLIDREFPNTDVADSTDPLWSFMPDGNIFWHNSSAPHIGEGLSRQERISDTVDLLTNAGFSWDVQPVWDPVSQQVIPGRGLRHNGTLVPEIELLAGNYDPDRANAALSIGQWLSEAGFPVTVVLADFNSILDPVFVQSSFDMYLGGWSLGDPSFPDYFGGFWHSRNDTATTGNYNIPGYNNPNFDALADDFLATSDIEQARTDVWEMQVILGTDLPYVPLYTRQEFDAYRRDRVTFPYAQVLDGIDSTKGMPALVSPTNP